MNWSKGTFADVVKGEKGNDAPAPLEISPSICIPIIHRINDELFYGTDLTITHQHGEQWVRASDTNVEHICGVSHFMPYCEHYEFSHTSYVRFKTYGCKLTNGNALPDGLCMKKDRPSIRRRNRTQVLCGTHYTVFPTQDMKLDEFATKLRSIYRSESCTSINGSCEYQNQHTTFAEYSSKDADTSDDKNDSSSQGRPGKSNKSHQSSQQSATHSQSSAYGGSAPRQRSCQFPPCDELPADAVLRQASIVLYEFARHIATPPNRAIRCYYFHSILCDDDACCEWLFTGDALSQHLASALDFCEDAPNSDAEETRDYIRYMLENVLPDYEAKPRAENMEGSDTIVLFGDKVKSSEKNVNDGHEPISFDVVLSAVVSQLKDIIHRGYLDAFAEDARCGDVGRGFSEILTSISSSPAGHQSYWHFERLLDELVLCAPESCECEAASLTAVIPVNSISYAKMFRDFMTDNPTLADAFVAALLCYGNHSGCADTMLRVASTSSYANRLLLFPESRKHTICATLYETDRIPQTTSKAYATGIGKCITALRDKAWCRHGRIMVMCASPELDVELSLLCPEYPDTWAWRNAFIDGLMAIPGVCKQIKYCGRTDSLVMNPASDIAQLFFLVSFDEHIHYLALSEMEKCFDRLKIRYGEFANLIVEEDDVKKLTA